MRLYVCFVAFVFIVVTGFPAPAQPLMDAVSYQGKLTTAEGRPVADSSYQMVFSLYETETGSEPFWQMKTAVSTVQGVFSTVLTPLSASNLMDRKEVWLEVRIAEQEPIARVKLASVPFALQAEKAYDLVLPFSGTASSSSPALSVTNSGTGAAIRASGALAGHFTGNVNIAGNLGVGTTSPAHPVDVSGIIRSSTGGFRFPDGSIQTTAGITGSGTAQYIPLMDSTRSLTDSRLYQSSGGNIGIGTQNPTGTLTINSPISNMWPTVPSIVIGDPNGTGAGIWMGKDAPNMLSMGFIGSGATSYAFLYTNGGQPLRIQTAWDAGNVGIGISNPDEKLTVNGNIKLDQANANNGNLSNGSIKFGAGATGEGMASKRTTGGNQNGLDFYTSNTTRLSITADGKVGVGTTSPQERLSIAGNLKVDQEDQNNGDLTNGAIKFGSGNTGEGIASKRKPGDNWAGLNFYTGYAIRMTVANGGNVGIGTTLPEHKLHVNGSVAGNGNYLNLSDGRFKENVETLPDALATVRNLRGVNFNWKVSDDPNLELPEGRQVGFIAQELQQVLPEAVSRGQNGNLSVSYSTVVPVLVEAVKEQQKQIEELKRIIAEMNSSKR